MMPWALVLAADICAGFKGCEKKNLLRALMLAVVAQQCLDIRSMTVRSASRSVVKKKMVVDGYIFTLKPS